MAARGKAVLEAFIVGTLLAIGAAPTPAWAVDPWETAEPAPNNYPAPNSICQAINAATACFSMSGDDWYVLDRFPDGLAVYVNWQNQLMNNVGSWSLYRSGQCRSNLGTSNWGVCYKDYYENSTANNAYGGKGSQLRWQACADAGAAPDICSSWTPWRNNTS